MRTSNSDTEIALALASRYLAEIGMETSVIAQAAESIQGNIKRQAIQLVRNSLEATPNAQLGPHVNTLFRMIYQSIGILDEAPSSFNDEGFIEIEAISEQQSYFDVPAAQLCDLPEDQGIDDQEDELSPSGSPATALYTYTPKKHIDLHPDLMFKAGLFRALPTQARHPSLDETKVYELTKPLSNGYRYMTVKGDVLDPYMDLVIYLCLMYWFGRMSKVQFEKTIKKPIKMTIREFFSPIPEEYCPSEYMKNKNLVKSLTRLKALSLVFYPTQDDALGLTKKQAAMITNICGTLDVGSDGYIEISPTPQLRDLYTMTQKVIPINRISMVSLPSQMARLLSLWLASKAGYSNESYTPISVELTTRDLLQEIHPKESHTFNDIMLLSTALNEMTWAGLVRYSVEFHNVKAKNKKNLTMTSVLCFSAHRLSHRKVFAGEMHEDSSGFSKENPILDTGKGMASSKKNVTGGILDKLNYPKGNLSKDSRVGWWQENEVVILKIIEGLRSLVKTMGLSLFCSRMSVAETRRMSTIKRMMDSVGFVDKTKTINSILETRAENGTSPLASVLKEISPLKPGERASDWFSTNSKAISAFKDALKKSKSPMIELAKLNKRSLQGRLINPLHAAGKVKDSAYYSGMFEAGRASIEEEKMAKRNKGRSTVKKI